MTDIERIRTKIETAISGALVQVANPQGDGLHYEVTVTSDKFEGVPLVKQHRLVMEALREEFSSTVHALQLKTFTPAQWAQRQTSADR